MASRTLYKLPHLFQRVSAAGYFNKFVNCYQFSFHITNRFAPHYRMNDKLSVSTYERAYNSMKEVGME